ncbi:hypothetical protein RHSIM_Rhsim05G0166400 [Rhododendron simsii]|uniref:Integrase zinc-binding domain-containing protein n=1 Tax=Rhododendron simsii TaxID=118357 RepID=A0A834GXB3_RHOSS|nr:hypothetical protein RHSIM_Rhsim05G0166400 [Rhododendron simsii]
MHRYAVVPSMYHQCMKGIYKNGLVTIVGSQKPFKLEESHMADAIFYNDANEEEPPAPPRGIPIPKWDEISKEGSPSIGNPNEKKRARDAILAKARVPAEDNVDLKVVKYTSSLAESHEVHEDEGDLVEYLNQCCSLSSLMQKQPNKPRKKNKKRELPTIQKPTPDEGQEEQPPALQEVTVAPECLQDGPRPQKQELEEVNLAPKGMPPKPIFLAKDLPAEKKKALIVLIREYIDVFAWNYDEMPGLDPGVTTHKLNVVPSARPVKQGVRFYKPDGSGGLLARCIGEEEAKVKIQEVHERSCGTRDVSLYRRLQRQGYYWPNMATDAAELQNKCPKCRETPSKAECNFIGVYTDWRKPYIDFLTDGTLPPDRPKVQSSSFTTKNSFEEVLKGNL